MKLTPTLLKAFSASSSVDLIGVYQHVERPSLQRYTTEFDFRYNHRAKLGYDDSDRTTDALKGITGKRLTYRRLG